MRKELMLLPALFRENEILQMTEEMLIGIRGILDDMLAGQIIECFKKYRENPTTGNEEYDRLLANKMEFIWNYLEPRVKLLTFYREYAESGLKERISTISVESAIEAFPDRDKSIADLKWLLDNKVYWIDTIPARKKEDYDYFMDALAKFSADTKLAHLDLEKKLGCQLEMTMDAIKLTTKHKDIFYRQNERERPTGLKIVRMYLSTIEEVMHGLEFTKWCEQAGIAPVDRRYINV